MSGKIDNRQYLLCKTRQRQDRGKTETRQRQDRDKTETRQRQDRDKTETRQRQDRDKTDTKKSVKCYPLYTEQEVL